ncbi:MAG TPA: YciI family protein [Mycobacteriales bacterium]|nr:YciI family protein [Mycobacteriales bacterium]
MKQYMLAVHGTHEDPPPADVMEQMFVDVDKVNKELVETGAWVFGGGLMEPSDATVVRVERGQVMLTDGPFVETKEQLGGFWVIRAENLDEALAWAEKATRACRSPVEVRPFQEEPES